MEENIKSRVIIILGILNFIFLMVAVGSCSNVKKHRLELDRERATGWDLQKKIEEFKMNVGKELDTKTQELEAEKAAHEVTKKALAQEQLVNESLKKDLAKVSKLKETLEEDLKDVLVPEDKSKLIK